MEKNPVSCVITKIQDPTECLEASGFSLTIEVVLFKQIQRSSNTNRQSFEPTANKKIETEQNDQLPRDCRRSCINKL